jgi:hypothetical protein
MLIDQSNIRRNISLIFDKLFHNRRDAEVVSASAEQNNIQTIYVQLLDEGTQAYRPVKAEKISDSVYKISEQNIYDTDDEFWEFPPSSIVVCEKQKLSGGTVLVALRECPADKNSEK